MGYEFSDDHNDEQAQRILFYLTDVDGPEDGPIFRQVQAFARNYQQKIDKGQYLRVLAISGIKNNVVPAIITAMNRRWPGELGGRVSDVAKQRAAEMIFDDVVRGEIENVYIGEGRETPAFRRSRRVVPGSVMTIPAETIGHHVEARVNAAAKQAGLLGRRR